MNKNKKVTFWHIDNFWIELDNIFSNDKTSAKKSVLKENLDLSN